MYDVATHHFGRKTAGNGWQLDLEGHEHRHVKRCRRKADAVATADAQPVRATVYDWQTLETIYDNGKPSGER
jgi:hypothetical protein